MAVRALEMNFNSAHVQMWIKYKIIQSQNETIQIQIFDASKRRDSELKRKVHLSVNFFFARRKSSFYCSCFVTGAFLIV